MTSRNVPVVNRSRWPGSWHRKIEFLCKGQQVVDGIHPDTHRPYSWHGGTLRSVGSGSPSITKAEAHQLVDDTVDLLVRDFGFTPSAG